jgi:hypothetical protein
MVLGFLFCGTAYAEKFVTLPDGNKIDVSKLSQEEIYNLIKISSKAVSEPQFDTVMETMKGINPSGLNEWGKLITGTIRDICSDLNVTVNEFVKTPVGMGVSALIIYKVAGKDFISNAMDILLAIPLWFTITFINGCLLWYFFSMITVIHDVKYIENNEVVYKKEPTRVHRYRWDSNDARVGMGWGLAISEIIITIICLIIVFS